MVSAINLDRFRTSTQRFLQNVSSGWTPLYSISGNHTINASAGINGESSFTLNTQNSLPNLAVNQSAGFAASLLGNSQYIQFNPFHPGAVQVSSLDNANTNVRPFGFDPSNGVVPALLVGGGSTPTTAPTVPGDFATLANRYEISEGNFSALVASGEFDLPTIGLGLRYTTDGTNITGVKYQPSPQALQARDRVLVDNINTAGIIYPNREAPASLTAQPGDLALRLGQQTNPEAAGKLDSNQNPFRVLSPQTPIQATPPNGLEPRGLPKPGLSDPAFALAQLAQTTPSQGLTVIGETAEANAVTTRHMAGVQAKLDINVSLESQQQIGKLHELATQQLAIATQGLPLPAERNGIIPLVTPHIHQPPPGSDIISTADHQSTLNLSTEMNDRQSSGTGLMLGLMLGGSSSQGGTDAGNGAFNPFSGESGQQQQGDPQQRKPRKPLYLSA